MPSGPRAVTLTVFTGLGPVKVRLVARQRHHAPGRVGRELGLVERLA